MNLIDCSYFYVGPLQIENACPIDDLDNNASAVQQAITAYIERYEREFLDALVGDELASYIEEKKDSVTVDKKFGELLNMLRPPFAHYVYFKIAGDVNQNMTIDGLVKLKSANDHQSPRQRMVRVWNDMVKLNRKFVKWAETSDYDVYYQVNMITPVNQFNL